jgi:transposase-like protein
MVVMSLVTNTREEPMVQQHPTTPEQRAQYAARMIAQQGTYGLVSQLSRESGVSRPTLYAWRDRAQQTLLQAFTPPEAVAVPSPSLARQILTLWITHTSVRGIQLALRELTQHSLSLATISAVLTEAQQRALDWMQIHVPASSRALALDEIYANARRGAYLHVVDVHSGAVWASEGPLAVDCDSWTLVLWSLEERGLHWDRLVSDDGPAIQAACTAVTPDIPRQSDQWHLLHRCAQLQGRLKRAWQRLVNQTPAVRRQAARLAAGQRPRGRVRQTDLGAHTHAVAQAQQVVEAVAYLTQELHRLLEVVVVDRHGLLDAAQRQADLEALLELLAEVVTQAEGPQQGLVQQLLDCVRRTLPAVLTFVPQVARVQQDLARVLGPDAQALLGWAWLRRKTLEWTSQELVAQVPASWQAAARVLLATWDAAVRVSSAVERWHSILRPHLAVHRRLSTGMLALLAVWHNHRVFRRGSHKGKNPLQLSGIADAPSDWLVALGYPPAAAEEPPASPDMGLALAA